MKIQMLIVRNRQVEGIIAGWLDEKAGRTQSKRTQAAYQDTLADFRRFLQGQRKPLDLDSTPSLLIGAAQAWAGHSKREGATVANTTYNLRLAILSSFYRYWQQVTTDRDIPNPIAHVKRRPVQDYEHARALSESQLAGMTGMQRTTPAGLRDYALLAVALFTGRRASELAALCKERIEGREIISQDGQTISLWFKRCKGNKQAGNVLSPAVSAAVLAWITCCYGSLKEMPDGAPLWPVLAAHGRGQPMAIRSISNLCEKHLGTSKVHATRHTFAQKMEEAGAKPSEIAGKLLHNDPATVQRYLEKLKSAENPYADKLEVLLGLR